MNEYRLKALAFALTFLSSVLLSANYPGVRDRVSWQVQYELCQAAARGQTTKLRLLAFVGADVHGFNTTFQPILFAARNGQTEVVRALLDRGVDVNSIGLWHQTPLMEAIVNDQVGTAALLLSRGADACIADHHDGTSLWQAVSEDQTYIVRLLMKRGGRRCKDAESALSAAVMRGQKEMVKELLAGGVDPRDVTATHLVLPLTKVAARHRDRDILKMLRAAGAK